eukprot:5029311-Karenia_brevis.AAC.1
MGATLVRGALVTGATLVRRATLVMGATDVDAQVKGTCTFIRICLHECNRKVGKGIAGKALGKVSSSSSPSSSQS